MFQFKAFSTTFERFVRSEQSGSVLLIICTVTALLAANFFLGDAYAHFWHTEIGGLAFELWVNDALMAVFFLLIGLELKRELIEGALSDVRRALLPVIAALGGMVVPAAIHFALNGGRPTQGGFGIPMATDIAFALGALALLGRRVPFALRVFVVAFAVMDDLGAIIVIALFYSHDLAPAWLLGVAAVWLSLMVLNRRLRVQALAPYLIGGALLWFLMLRSGVHATLAGVLLAFTIPYAGRDGHTPSKWLEHALAGPVAFLILPIFALANAGVILDARALQEIRDPNSLGIIGGLVLGKPVGIVLFSALAVGLGLCRLPQEVRWSHMLGAGMLGGIGFTMSIFITNLAFVSAPDHVNGSKLAILSASLLSGVLGYLWLSAVSRRTAASAVPA